MYNHDTDVFPAVCVDTTVKGLQTEIDLLRQQLAALTSDEAVERALRAYYGNVYDDNDKVFMPDMRAALEAARGDKP